MSVRSWPKTRLKNIVEPVQSGVWGADPAGDHNDILCVRVADFDRQRLGLKSVATVRSVPQRDQAPRVLQPGDILLEKSGGTDANPVGFTVMFDGDYPAVSSNFIGRVRVRKGHNSRFWLYALAASYMTRRTEKCVRRTTGIQNLDQGAFFNELFLVPKFEEQQVVADYLDRETARIDTLIGEQQRLIEMLRERRAAAIATGLHSSADHLTRLKYVSTVQTGVTLSGEGNAADPEWPYLRVANVQAGYVDLQEIKTIRVPSNRAAASTLRAGDVLMTEGGDIDKLGRGALWRGELARMLHQNHVFAVRPNQALDSEFLIYWLDGPEARTYFRTTAKQTTNLAGTNKWTLGNLPVPLPPLEEQKRTVALLDEQTRKIDTLIAEVEQFIELSHERRAALITAAVTGQIDVREMV